MQLRIREWRHHFQYSQAVLATASGLSRETISAIETGRQEAGIAQLEAIACAMQIRVSDLLDESPCPQCPYRQKPPPAGPPEDEGPRFTVHTGGAPPRTVCGDEVRTRARQAVARASQVRQRAQALLMRLGHSAGLLVLLPWLG